MWRFEHLKKIITLADFSFFDSLCEALKLEINQQICNLQNQMLNGKYIG